MREATGSTAIFKIVLIFTFIFVGFIAVAIIYNKAFKMKNESLRIIEKNEGTTTAAIETLNSYLKTNGYNAKGKCTANEWGITDLNTNKLIQTNNRSYYCISYYTRHEKIYYNVKLFFKFNLPIIGDIVDYEVRGQTKDINLWNSNCQYLEFQDCKIR